MLTTLWFAVKIKFVLGNRIESNEWEVQRILYHKTNKEALTVLYSDVKRLERS